MKAPNLRLLQSAASSEASLGSGVVLASGAAAAEPPGRYAAEIAPTRRCYGQDPDRCGPRHGIGPVDSHRSFYSCHRPRLARLAYRIRPDIANHSRVVGSPVASGNALPVHCSARQASLFHTRGHPRQRAHQRYGSGQTASILASEHVGAMLSRLARLRRKRNHRASVHPSRRSCRGCDVSRWARTLLRTLCEGGAR
jgi:hypothetical protein